MSSSTDLKLVTLTAGEDLSDSLYETLAINSSGQVVKASGTVDVIGLCYESLDAESGAAGEPVAVALVAGGGIAEVKVNQAGTPGQLLFPSSTAGEANIGTGSSTTRVFGVALESADAAGDIIKVLLGYFSVYAAS